jgi:hypothetical protein
MKKVIKLTESDLTRIVKRVIEEQGSKGMVGSLMSADPAFIKALRKEIPNNNFKVDKVSGNVIRNKNNQKLTPGMFISENESLTFSPDSRVYITLSKTQDNKEPKSSGFFYPDYQFFVQIEGNKLTLNSMG